MPDVYELKYETREFTVKMKRIYKLIMTLTIITVLAACSSKADPPKLLAKEGISPYELSENGKYILQSFGMEDNSQIITFHAPEKAITLNVNVYKLENAGGWENIVGGGISIGTERKPTEGLIGTFTMQLKENYAIDLEIKASTKSFLQDFQKIELNKEIPVAIMVYDSGTTMRSYSLKDYFEPSKFEGMDLAQVVTLTFSDKEF